MNGLLKDEICNRNGCKGIIEVEEKEGGCSCHINPPCSFCTDKVYSCPKCGWNSKDDTTQLGKDKKNYDVFNFKIRTFADLDKTKIDWISKTHTHFTMIKEGVYPVGKTMEDVRKLVVGTFGGRFELFQNGRFKYIAYTD
jgi:hypothetical protein